MTGVRQNTVLGGVVDIAVHRAVTWAWCHDITVRQVGSYNRHIIAVMQVLGPIRFLSFEEAEVKF